MTHLDHAPFGTRLCTGSRSCGHSFCHNTFELTSATYSPIDIPFEANWLPRSGYKVIFVPFESGKPSGGAPVDVLTGFLGDDGSAFGRPVGVVLDKQGALLVADDVGNVVWRVTFRP